MSTQKLVHSVQSSIVDNSLTVEKICLLTEKWINIMCYSHTMEYYKATKMNEVLIYATTWINIENMLCGRSQSQKTTYSVISFI